jgi:hypothetical protein
MIERRTYYFIETLEKKFNNKELMPTSWAMNTGMITHKGAKHLTIIDWNFWNLSIIHSPRQWHLFNNQLKSDVDHSRPNITIAFLQDS